MYFNSKLNLKIVDFGNAAYSSSLCNNEIQTRQYRAPEVILGNNYTSAADVWSVGCILFELMTGELLYQPHSGEDFNEDDDHLAQIWENIGEFPVEWANKSKKAWKFFNRDVLKKIPELHVFLIKDILKERYKFSQENAELASQFLRTMLEIEPEKRSTAEEALKHSWLGKKSK